MVFSSLSHDNTTQLVLQTIDAYERSAKECVVRWNKRRPRRPSLLVEWLEYLPAGTRLLDLGCGGGRDAGDLDLRGYRVVGVDRTSALLSAGRRRYRSLPLVRADLRQLPFHAMSFDGLWAAASLMHLPKPEARRILADLCKDATCLRFWKMHQRGGSPKPIERHRMKGELAEVGTDQRQ